MKFEGVLAFVCGIILGFICGAIVILVQFKSFMQEAVDKGHAEWVANQKNASVSFQWKEVAQ